MIKRDHILVFLITLIVLGSCFASYKGLSLAEVSKDRIFTNLYGEAVILDGKGIYFRDSVSVAAQGRAADLITVVMAVPLLLFSTFSKKNAVKMGLLRTGTLAYFLYTYTSYVFLWQYNALFLLYVILMSASGWALAFSIVELYRVKFSQYFKKTMPTKALAGFQVFIALMIGGLWLSKIASSNPQTPPVGLEHYTTLVIQGMDLGILVPLLLFAANQLWRKKDLGYLLSGILIFKGFTMLSAILLMIVFQIISGVRVSFVEIGIFTSLAIGGLLAFSLLLKSVVEVENEH